MCTAMLGATPVYWCTCAASCAFSHGVRGTPGWPNTLNRVPVFPKAQEGSSISCCLSAALTAVRSRMRCSSPFSVPSPDRVDLPPVSRGVSPHGDFLEVELADVAGVEGEDRKS